VGVSSLDWIISGELDVSDNISDATLTLLDTSKSTLTYTYTTVPAPSTTYLLLAGLLGLVASNRPRTLRQSRQHF